MADGKAVSVSVALVVGEKVWVAVVVDDGLAVWVAVGVSVEVADEVDVSVKVGNGVGDSVDVEDGRLVAEGDAVAVSVGGMSVGVIDGGVAPGSATAKTPKSGV